MILKPKKNSKCIWRDAFDSFAFTKFVLW